MEVRITIDGRDADVEALWDWLHHEPQLRGQLRMRSTPATEGTMGASTDLVIQAAAAMAGAGALWAALSRSLSVWLTQRRSDITIKLTRLDGRQMSLTAKRVTDPEALLRQFLDASASPSAKDEEH